MKSHFKKFGNGYVVNKWIIRASLIAVFLLVIGIVLKYGISWKPSHYYITCPADSITPCKNPLYHNCDEYSPVCDLETLLPGTEYGQKPPEIINNFSIYAFVIMSVGLLINHLAYNKNWKPKGAV
jgi:hypothetical protein